MAELSSPAHLSHFAMLAADVASVTPYSYAEAYEALLRGNGLLADAWDEGRAALQQELARSWSLYDTGDPTPNPYRG